MKKKKILIIEDDLILSTTLADNLIKEGFDILQANDGEVGLALALSKKPDLILLDILLPKVDGITVLNKLREDPLGKEIPVIVLSNLSEPAKVAATITENVHDYLVKINWKIDDVIKIIKEKLEA